MRLSRHEIKCLMLAKLDGREIGKVFKTLESLNKACDDFALTLSFQSKNKAENLKIYQEQLAPSRSRENFKV